MGDCSAFNYGQRQGVQGHRSRDSNPVEMKGMVFRGTTAGTCRTFCASAPTLSLLFTRTLPSCNTTRLAAKYISNASALETSPTEEPDGDQENLLNVVMGTPPAGIASGKPPEHQDLHLGPSSRTFCRFEMS